jgi:hypothetical protein
MSANPYEDEQSSEQADKVAVIVAGGVAGQLAKSEVEAQLDAAHRYPREIKKFMNDAMTLATFNKEIAGSCMFALPRGGKVIEGPSIRLAEICISAYGNLHVGARVVGAEDKEVISQGVCWDLEKNNRITIEKRRKITDKKGNRFNDDMITMTGNAAASIALRDAAFRIIPRTYVNMIYEAAKKVAVGEASTMAARRAEVFDKLVKMGAMPDRILSRIGKAAIEDIGVGELAVLIGFGTAIHSGSEKVDDIFPPVVVEKAVVDMNAIKAGKEENRGHGNENMAGATGKPKAEPKKETKAAKTETKAPEPVKEEPKPETTTTQLGGDKNDEKASDDPLDMTDPEALYTEAQKEYLTRKREEMKIDPNIWITWARKTFDVKMASKLSQKSFARAKAWTDAGGKEESNG